MEMTRRSLLSIFAGLAVVRPIVALTQQTESIVEPPKAAPAPGRQVVVLRGLSDCEFIDRHVKELFGAYGTTHLPYTGDDGKPDHDSLYPTDVALYPRPRKFRCRFRNSSIPVPLSGVASFVLCEDHIFGGSVEGNNGANQSQIRRSISTSDCSDHIQ